MNHRRFEPHTSRRKCLDGPGGGSLVSVAAHVVGAQRVDRDQQHVRAILLSRIAELIWRQLATATTSVKAIANLTKGRMVDSFRSVAANVSQLKLCGKSVDSSQIKD